MKLIIEKDERAMSESCMQIVLGEMMQDKRVNISLTSYNVQDDDSLCKGSEEIRQDRILHLR